MKKIYSAILLLSNLYFNSFAMEYSDSSSLIREWNAHSYYHTGALALHNTGGVMIIEPFRFMHNQKESVYTHLTIDMNPSSKTAANLNFKGKSRNVIQANLNILNNEMVEILCASLALKDFIDKQNKSLPRLTSIRIYPVSLVIDSTTDIAHRAIPLPALAPSSNSKVEFMSYTTRRY